MTDTVRPSIGAYRRKEPASTNGDADTDLEIVDRRPKVENAASALTEGIQEELRDSIDRTKESAAKAKSYTEILLERDISLAKAHGIVDSMLEQGYYEETIPVTKSSTVTFRTRVHADYVRYVRALETYSPKYVEEQQEIQIRYFLAASLVAFKGHVFVSRSKSKDEDSFFDTKLEWIASQPETVVRLLASKLSKFDQQIQIVMSEGIVENF